MGLIWQLQFLVLFLTFFIPLPVGMSFCFKNFAGFSIGVNNLRVWLSSRVHALNLGIRWWNRLSRLGFTLGFLLYCVNSGLVIWFAIRSIGIMELPLRSKLHPRSLPHLLLGRHPHQ